ncbi:hypothetical protein SK128_022689, partial [Halocaridina rubra]
MPKSIIQNYLNEQYRIDCSNRSKAQSNHKNDDANNIICRSIPMSQSGESKNKAACNIKQ